MTKRRRSKDMESDEEDVVEEAHESGEADDEDETPSEDLYSILGIAKTATAKEIRQAYLKLALKFHPDRNKGDNSAKETFQKIGRAYEILSDPNKKVIYDETGTIGDDFFSKTPAEGSWEAHWRALFKKVSPEDIDNFAKSYRNSKEEEQDLKKAYVEYKGDVEKIMDAVPLCTDDDLDRFVNTLKQHIQTGELKEYSKFEKSITDFRASLEKRKKAQDKEALEAEEILKKAKEQEDLNALALSIRGNKTKQQAKLEELVANLESKYVTKGGNKNRRGKSSKSAKYEEPSEEEFQKARERLEKRMSNNKSAPVNKNKKVKRTK